MTLLLMGFALGWCAHWLRWRYEAKISVRDTLVRQGFDTYLETNGELHPQDPRRARIRVVR
jgi:hypothetical protein